MLKAPGPHCIPPPRVPSDPSGFSAWEVSSATSRAGTGNIAQPGDKKKIGFVTRWARLFVFDGHLCELSQLDGRQLPVYPTGPGLSGAQAEPHTLNFSTL